MNPAKELLAKAIEQKNEFIPDESIRFCIEAFNTAGRINDVEKEELVAMLPQEVINEVIPIEEGEIVDEQSSI